VRGACSRGLCGMDGGGVKSHEKAKEIRATQLSGDWTEPSQAMLNGCFEMLREIAAQLAELNGAVEYALQEGNYIGVYDHSRPGGLR
jgi:hypothetical protein